MNVGLIGKKGSGKSTLAKFLVERYSKDYDVKVLSFANPLKELIFKITKLDDSAKNNTDSFKGEIKFHSLEKKLRENDYPLLTTKEFDNLRALEYYPVCDMYRLLLQTIGTDIFRSRNPMHWINLFDDEYNKYRYNKNVKVIIDDIRFINEYDYTVSKMDYVVRITRPNISMPETMGLSHDSEIEQDKIECNFEIINDCDEASLNNLFNKEISKIERNI